MVVSWKHHRKEHKGSPKNHILYESTYIKNPEKDPMTKDGFTVARDGGERKN